MENEPTQTPAVLDRKALMRVANQKPPKFLNPEQIRLIISGAKKRRYRVLFNVLWQTGARVSEALSLEADGIDWLGHQIRFVTLKQRGRAERYLPMKDELLGVLSTYVHEEGLKGSDRLFKMSPQAVHQELKAILKVQSLPGWVHVHTFRHSFAVNCLRQGIPINVLKELLGHRNVENTMVYLQVFRPQVQEQFNKVVF